MTRLRSLPFPLPNFVTWEFVFVASPSRGTWPQPAGLGAPAARAGAGRGRCGSWRRGGSGGRLLPEPVGRAAAVRTGRGGAGRGVQCARLSAAAAFGAGGGGGGDGDSGSR